MKIRFLVVNKYGHPFGQYYVLQYKKHWWSSWNFVCDNSVMRFPVSFDSKKDAIDFYNRHLRNL